ncbi:O-antigen ligase family protein [Flavobacterium sp.]
MTDKEIIKLILLHVGIGILIAFYPFVSKIYTVLIVLTGIFFVIKNRNQNHEVLYVIAYLAGSEILLRTTRGSISYEFSRYFMLIFSCLGLFYSGLPKKMNPYWLFLIFIIPGIFIPIDALHQDVKKKIIFDFLGPFCLGVCALYTYGRKISIEHIQNIIGTFALPVLACSVFLMVSFPYKDGVVLNTESNMYLSGSFAPNQMATILGLGAFICFARTVMVPSSGRIFIVSVVVFCLVYYRALLTFSRGGVYTGLAIIGVFSVFAFLRKEKEIRKKLVLMLILIPFIFVLTSYQTENHLYHRYTNRNIHGATKPPDKHGRESMALEELQYFKQNPVIGLGVGRTKEIRRAEYGTSISTHNEITRLLAEHGILGILSLILLISVPIFRCFKNREYIYLLSFYFFWLLTINHSGMRVAAPSFIYALALLSAQKEETSLA